MSCLSLYLLGPPRIELDSEPIQVDTRKAIALLAYMAINRESHRRDALVNLLWPEYDQAHGRAALRRTLYALRKALGDSPSGSPQTTWLDVDREIIGLNLDVEPSAPRGTGPSMDPLARSRERSERELWLDVDQFHAHLGACLAHGHAASDVCPVCLSHLAAAAALYRDDFMSGFGLTDSYNFDDWQFFQGEELRRELGGALEKLVQGHGAARLGIGAAGNGGGGHRPDGGRDCGAPGDGGDGAGATAAGLAGRCLSPSRQDGRSFGAAR